MSYKGRLSIDACMDMPFNELHEFYRIAYLRMQAKMEAQKREEEKRKKEEEINRINQKQQNLRQARGPRKPWTPTDVNQQTSQTTVPPSSVTMDDIEEFLEDGGLI